MIKKVTKEHIPQITEALEEQKKRYLKHKKMDDEVLERHKNSAISLSMRFGLQTYKEKNKVDVIQSILHAIQKDGEAFIEKSEQEMIGW